MSERWPADGTDVQELEVEEEVEQPEAEVAEEPEAQHAYGELDIPDDVNVLEGMPDGTRRGVAIVASRFNGEITNRLLETALAELDAAGVRRDAVTVMPVPGAFEEIQPQWARNIVVGFGRLRGGDGREHGGF